MLLQLAKFQRKNYFFRAFYIGPNLGVARILSSLNLNFTGVATAAFLHTFNEILLVAGRGEGRSTHFPGFFSE